MQIRQKVKSLFLIESNLSSSSILALLTLLYAPLLIYWVDGWLNKTISTEHEYFSYALLGFPFAAYIAWRQQLPWKQLPSKTHPLGIGLLLLGVYFYSSGLTDLINLSLPVILTGLCLWFKGAAGLKLLRFPLLLVLLATPTNLPYLIAPYTAPLQAFIAATAGFILMQLGLDVTVNDIYIFVGGRIVEVAPYCAGLKMLMTSLYIALMLLYWTGALASRTKTILLLLGTVIASVVANIIRNTLLTFFHGTGQTQLFDWLHAGWGGDLYSAGLLAIVIVLLQLIERYFDITTED